MPPPACWGDLRGREAGRKCYIIGCGPTAGRRLCPSPVRICINESPILHNPDYWIRADAIEGMCPGSQQRFARARREAERSGAAILCPTSARPWPGEITFSVIDRFRVGMFDGLPVGEVYSAGGSLPVALGLAVWLGVAEIELVGIDFSPDPAGRCHFYDDDWAPADYPTTLSEFEEVFTRALRPAVERRGIRVLWEPPPWRRLAAAPGA